MIREVKITQARIPDFMPARIQICNGARAGFLGPVAVGILPQEMIIVRFVHNECDFRTSSGAFGFKGGHSNMRIISQNARDHTWARFWPFVSKGFESGWLSRLMKRRIALLFSATLCDLAGIVHIHRIGETVVRFSDCHLRVPSIGFIWRFRTCERTFARALS